ADWPSRIDLAVTPGTCAMVLSGTTQASRQARPSERVSSARGFPGIGEFSFRVIVRTIFLPASGRRGAAAPRCISGCLYSCSRFSGRELPIVNKRLIFARRDSRRPIRSEKLQSGSITVSLLLNAAGKKKKLPGRREKRKSK